MPGFVQDEQQQQRRLRLWKGMMRRGISSFISNRPDDFRRRARRGIPAEFRAEVWKAALGIERSATPGVYQEMQDMENKWLRIIEIDMPRTFPEDPYFDDKQQQSLRRILLAYSNMSPDVGYCQGMNYIAGFLLLVAQNGDFRASPSPEIEEETFWMLHALMDSGLSGFYQRSFPLLRRYLAAFDDLVAQTMPELQSHFQKENVQHGVYLHQWCLTLFINSVPLPMVLTFWDAIICCGLEELLPIAVSLLGILSQTLLPLQFEEIVSFFQSMRAGTQDTCDFTCIAKMVMDAREDIDVPEHIMAELSSPWEAEDLSMWSTPGAVTPGDEEHEFQFGEDSEPEIIKVHSGSSMLGDYVHSLWEDTKESFQIFSFGKSARSDSESCEKPSSFLMEESQA